jgi:hypothetical protein
MQLDKLGVPVELITPNYTDRIGVLKRNAPRRWPKKTFGRILKTKLPKFLPGSVKKQVRCCNGLSGQREDQVSSNIWLPNTGSHQGNYFRLSIQQPRLDGDVLSDHAKFHRFV